MLAFFRAELFQLGSVASARVFEIREFSSSGKLYRIMSENNK